MLLDSSSHPVSTPCCPTRPSRRRCSGAASASLPRESFGLCKPPLVLLLRRARWFFSGIGPASPLPLLTPSPPPRAEPAPPPRSCSGSPAAPACPPCSIKRAIPCQSKRMRGETTCPWRSASARCGNSPVVRVSDDPDLDLVPCLNHLRKQQPATHSASAAGTHAHSLRGRGSVSAASLSGGLASLFTISRLVLLEVLRPLQEALRHVDELREEVRPVAVDPLLPGRRGESDGGDAM